MTQFCTAHRMTYLPDTDEEAGSRVKEMEGAEKEMERGRERERKKGRERERERRGGWGV